MKYGKLLVAPTILFTAITVLIIFLWAVDAGLRQTGSHEGISLIRQVASLAKSGTAILWGILTLFVLWLVVVFFCLGARTERSYGITLQTYGVGLSGMTNYPKEPQNKRWLCLEGIVYPGDTYIETLDLLLDGEIIHAHDWSGKKGAALRVQFDVSRWTMAGQKQVELVTRVRDKTHKLGRKNLDFDVEPSGRQGHSFL